MVEDTFLKRGSFERWWSYHFFMPRYSPREQVGGLERRCIRWQIMRKNARKGSGSKKTAVTTAIQKEVSMHTRRGERDDGVRELERQGVRLMSFAQTVRREANVIYEDRATSQVDEVSRLENLWKRYRNVKKRRIFDAVRCIKNANSISAR